MNSFGDRLETVREFDRICNLPSIGGAIGEHPAIVAVDVLAAGSLEPAGMHGLSCCDEDIGVDAASIQIPGVESLQCQCNVSVLEVFPKERVLTIGGVRATSHAAVVASANTSRPIH